MMVWSGLVKADPASPGEAVCPAVSLSDQSQTLKDRASRIRKDATAGGKPLPFGRQAKERLTLCHGTSL